MYNFDVGNYLGSESHMWVLSNCCPIFHQFSLEFYISRFESPKFIFYSCRLTIHRLWKFSLIGRLYFYGGLLRISHMQSNPLRMMISSLQSLILLCLFTLLHIHNICLINWLGLISYQSQWVSVVYQSCASPVWVSFFSKEMVFLLIIIWSQAELWQHQSIQLPPSLSSNLTFPIILSLVIISLLCTFNSSVDDFQESH